MIYWKPKKHIDGLVKTPTEQIEREYSYTGRSHGWKIYAALVVLIAFVGGLNKFQGHVLSAREAGQDWTCGNCGASVPFYYHGCPNCGP